jgi:AcrR family transcriptional regulator
MNEYKTTVSPNASADRREEHESHGRVLQKRRTRQALLEAANRLRARGTVPTIEDVAAEAQVSRATVYRYYTAVDSLVADALFQADMPVQDLFDANMTAPVDRALAVERYVNDLLSADEIGLHLIVRNFVDNWLNSDPSDRTPRPGRRLPLLDSALAPFRTRLGARRLRCLRNALTLTIGTEALIAMRDVCLLSKGEARETLRWAVAALVHQAFLETPQGKIKTRGGKQG